MRKLFIVAAMLMASMFANAENIIVAYVTAGSNEVPDPTVMTHINYALLMEKSASGTGDLPISTSPSLPIPWWRLLQAMAAAVGSGILYNKVLT